MQAIKIGDKKMQFSKISKCDRLLVKRQYDY